ncbi:MAG: formylmethanofuran dehydrogenase subunit E family protein [Desulfobacterales bacterium]|nr:MAG: formylmethanofuran dehydrogenase subunit E family protein [Desulfobacterales bacterium]
MNAPKLCGITYDDFLIEMEAFHGHRSPGVLLGGLMLDRALEELGPTHYLNVVCETVVCLPDAIQILTPCTFGNGFLQVFDWGKFALTAYDRQTLSGVRTWLNHARISKYSLIHNWFERTGRPREKPLFDLIAKEMLTAAPQLIAHGSVRLHRALKDPNPVPTGQCPKCSDSYPLHLGPACPPCSGEGYYDFDIDNR